MTKPAEVAKAIEAEIRARPGANTPVLRDLRKAWTAKLKATPAAEVIEIALALAAARPQQTKWIAYELLRYHRGAYDAVSQPQLEAFASELAPGTRSTPSARSCWDRCGLRGGWATA